MKGGESNVERILAYSSCVNLLSSAAAINGAHLSINNRNAISSNVSISDVAMYLNHINVAIFSDIRINWLKIQKTCGYAININKK
jgi:hypothetical protein